VLRIVRLEGDAGRLVRGYSMGMRQRLGRALALLNGPDLLILDEPTNGLDPAGIHEMRDLIRRLPAETGVTVFLSSHLLGEVEQVATHIGIVHRGRLCFQGRPDDLHRQAQRERRLVIRADKPAQARSLTEDTGWTVSAETDGTLQVAGCAESDAAGINALLVRHGIGVSHLAMTQPSLEALFLRMTGEPASGPLAERTTQEVST
jgi:ABC-2 type transport system ATP-binding protein